jgi:hypothetical protein
MLFRCFLDDSKDQEQSKVFSSAGFLGGKDDWIALRVLWEQCLKECGINYFKASEWKMLQGEFARFKTPAYPIPKGREAANKIRALEGVFNEVLKGIEALDGKHQVAFVHDDGPDFDELRHYYHEYKATNPRHAHMMVEFIPLDDKLSPASSNGRCHCEFLYREWFEVVR